MYIYMPAVVKTEGQKKYIQRYHSFKTTYVHLYYYPVLFYMVLF